MTIFSPILRPAACAALPALLLCLSVCGCSGSTISGRGDDGGSGRPDGGSLDSGSSAGFDAAVGSDSGSPARVEECGNGLDDDLDSSVDEHCDCTPGVVEACYGGDPRFGGLGSCDYGQHRCEPSGEFHRWSACEGSTLPSDEVCGSGEDEDCDGAVDEGCEGCVVGDSRPCYSGPPGTEGVGACRAGAQTCTSAGWSGCEGEVRPTAESCAGGADEDCDGLVDCEDRDCTVGGACCVPDCGGRACGDDGCGGSCGTCPDAMLCTAAGTCACPSGTTACGSECCGSGTRCAVDHCVLNYYCPHSDLIRRQAAIFLVRIADGTSASPSAGSGFGDFAAGSAGVAFAEEAVRRGFMDTCGANRFCPTAAVTRAQLAEMLIRAMRGSSWTPPACRGLFSDLSCSRPEARYAEALYDTGVTSGCGSGRFCPDVRVARQQAATFVWRAYRWARGERPAPTSASPALRDVFLDTSEAGALFRDFIDEIGLIRLSLGMGDHAGVCSYTGQEPL